MKDIYKEFKDAELRYNALKLRVNNVCISDLSGEFRRLLDEYNCRAMVIINQDLFYDNRDLFKQYNEARKSYNEWKDKYDQCVDYFENEEMLKRQAEEDKKKDQNNLYNPK